MDQQFQPWYGRALTGAIALIAAGALLSVLVREGWRDAARTAPWLGLLTLACWATFWRPRVVVSAAGVRLVNVTRTIDVPWPAMRAVETRWALTLDTAYGRFRAWAAPAPGARAAVRTVGDRPTGTRVDGAPMARANVERRRDHQDTPSGAAAAMILEQWSALRAAGHLDDPRLERPRADVRWHVGTLALAAALVMVGVVTA